jgi:endonuclease YncB( thermonuclease family)
MNRNKYLIMPLLRRPAALFAAFCLLGSVTCPLTSLIAGEEIAGPVAVTVLRVIDGDTFVGEAHVWPGETVEVSIRIRGIDAPEMRSRCPAERLAAERSRAALAGLIDGVPVSISNIGGDKYYGRVLADVATEDGGAVAPRLLAQSFARPYHGGRRKPYCG